MRMVVEVSDELHTRLRSKAKEEGRPLSRIVRQVLESYLDQSTGTRPVELMAVSIDSKPGPYPGSGIKPITKKDQAKGRTRK